MHDAGEDSDSTGGAPRKRYEPPTLVVLGSLKEITGGPVDAGGDVNGMVISF